MLWTFIVIILPIATAASSNETRGIDELIFQLPNMIYTHMFLTSNCSKEFASTASNQLNRNLTIFAPGDMAWNSTFDMRNFSGFNNCTGNATEPELCIERFAANISRFSPNDLGNCLSVFASYLTIPGNYPNLITSDDGNSTINTLKTQLNDRLVGNNTNLNSTNYFVVTNKTSRRTTIRGGGNSTAQLVESHAVKNGHMYVVDNILLPPLSLNSTLDYFNINVPQTLNSTLSNLSNRTISIFMPFNLAELNDSAGFNFSSHIIPQAFFLNQSQPTTLNLTALDGSPLKIDIEANNTALINGTSSVVVANIPFAHGVLYLTNNTSSASDKTNTTTTSLRVNRSEAGTRANR